MIKMASAIEELAYIMCRETRDSKKRYQDDKDSLKRLLECMMEESIFATTPILGAWVLTDWRVGEGVGGVWLEFDKTITYEKRCDGSIAIDGGGVGIPPELIRLACEYADRIIPQWLEAKAEIRRLYDADELDTFFDGEEGKTKKKRKKE